MINTHFQPCLTVSTVPLKKTDFDLSKYPVIITVDDTNEDTIHLKHCLTRDFESHPPTQSYLELQQCVPINAACSLLKQSLKYSYGH